MSTIDSISNNYIKLILNKSICYCHKLQIINFDEQHIELFLQNSDNVKVQFLLSYYFFHKDKGKSMEFANYAIENKFGMANNIIGCAKEGIECIPYFKQALESGHIRAYSNLGLCYHEMKDHQNAMGYFQLGIGGNIVCCKFLYWNLYEQGNPNYLDNLLECAQIGCRSALYELFSKTKNHLVRHKMIKLGARRGYPLYIIKLIDYYEIRNRYKLLKLLNQHEHSDDSELLYHIAKKYIEIDLLKGIDIMYQAIKKGNRDAYLYLINTYNVFLDDNKAEIMMNFLKNTERTIADDLNLIIVYQYCNKIPEMNHLIDRMDNYHKNVALSRYYDTLNKKDKALECLLTAYYMDPGPEEGLDLEFEIGILYLSTDRNKGTDFLEKGVIKGDTRCNRVLAEIFYKNNEPIKACTYLINSCKNNEVIGYSILNEIINNNASFEIGKLLLYNDLDIGIKSLIRCGISNKIIAECASEYIFYTECGICFYENKQLKFMCGHSICINCLKNYGTVKCPYCATKINGFLKNKICL